MPNSIYEVIVSSIDKDGKIPFDRQSLPDEDYFFDDSPLKFMGGAFEGIMPLGKVTGISQRHSARKILKAVQRFAVNPCDKTRDILCNLLKSRYSVCYLETVVENLTIPVNKVAAFYEEAKKLLLSSADRNVVKYCIYFLCFGEVENDWEIILNLAKHDEFTQHAIRAVLFGLKEPNESIFNIARYVDGWGKVSAVEYLKPETDEIRSWLLRHGCKNGILDDHIALMCAEKGNLIEVISSANIDRELFVGAGNILKLLADDMGPGENMEDYRDGVQAVSTYLNHAKTMCSEIEDLLNVCAINNLLKSERALSSEMKNKGWTSELRDPCISICEGILTSPKWPPLIWEHVKSEDTYKNYLGRAAARKLGIDIWDDVFHRLQTISFKDNDYSTEKSTYYLELADTEKAERFQKLVDFAEVTLPLQKIARGPGTEIGIGLEYEDNSCLDHLLQNLENKEGVGTKLLEAGLWSPVIHNRYAALHVLETWDRQYYSETIINRLRDLKKREPDKNIRKIVLRLIKAKKL